MVKTLSLQAIKRLPKCEFILNTIAKTAQENNKLTISSENLGPVIYLIQTELQEKYNTSLGYNFKEFSASGPYDEQLINDLKAWGFLEFIKDEESTPYKFTNIRLNDERAKGDIYKDKVVESLLENKLGGQNTLQYLQNKFKEYLEMPSEDLIKQSYLTWRKDYNANEILDELFDVGSANKTSKQAI